MARREGNVARQGARGCTVTLRTGDLAWSRPARLFCAMLLCCAFCTFSSAAAQQFGDNEDKAVPAKAPDGKREAPGRVEVQPVAKDQEIRQRIADILKTTGWFGAPEVAVQDGIVFLKGTTENDESRQWAEIWPRIRRAW
jgi:small conductance mechanosensitive channel